MNKLILIPTSSRIILNHNMPTKFVYISISDSKPHSGAVSQIAVPRPTVNGKDHGFDAIPSNEDEAKNGGKKGLEN